MNTVRTARSLTCMHASRSVSQSMGATQATSALCSGLASDLDVRYPIPIVSNRQRSCPSMRVNQAIDIAPLSFCDRFRARTSQIAFLICGATVSRGWATKCATLLYKRTVNVLSLKSDTGLDLQ